MFDSSELFNLGLYSFDGFGLLGEVMDATEETERGVLFCVFVPYERIFPPSDLLKDVIMLRNEFIRTLFWIYPLRSLTRTE